MVDLVAPASSALFDRVRSLMRESDRPFVERFTPHVIELTIVLPSGPLRLYVSVFEESEEIIVHSVAPFLATASDYGRAAEFLARANHGLSQGTFELSFASGELRFRTSLYVDQLQLSARLLQKVVMSNALLMDKYLPALASVVLDGESPAQAIARVES
jgi:hypothetical protein